MSRKKGYPKNVSLLKKAEQRIIGMSSRFINKTKYRLTNFLRKNFWGIVITIIASYLISQHFYLPPEPDFKLTIDNPPLENYRNSTFTLNITVDDIYNYNKSVLLNVREMPDGFKVDFSFNNLTPSFDTHCDVFIPSNLSDGKYSILIDGNGIHPKTININIRNRLPIISDLKPSDLPLTLNNTHFGFNYTWKAISNDPDGDPIYFRFFLGPSMSPDNWIELTSGWSLNGTCNFPVPRTSGNYTLEVWATDSPDIWQNLHLCNCGCLSRSFFIDLPDNNLNQNPTIDSLNPDKVSPKPLNTTVNWTVEARDHEKDPISYRFLVNGTPVTDWQSGNQWTWTASKPGTSQIMVQVKDDQHSGPQGEGGNRSAEFTITALAPLPQPAKLNESPVLRNLFSSLESPQLLLTTVSWTAQANDVESDPISYRFLVNGTPVTDWQPENQWTWTASEPGTSQIMVQVKDNQHSGPQGVGGNRSAEFTITALAPVPQPAKLNESPVLRDLVSNLESPQLLLTTVAWTAQASDVESDPITYRFLVNGTPVADWQSGNQWTWTASKPGTSQIVVQVKDDQHSGPQGVGGNRSAEFTITALAPLPSSVVSEYLVNEDILKTAEEKISLFTYDEFLNELKNKKIDTINFEAMRFRNPLSDITEGWCIEEKSDYNKSLLYEFPYCINIQQLGINDNSEYTIKLYLDANNNPQYITYTKTNISTKICTEVSRIPQGPAIRAIDKLSLISTSI